MGNCKFRFSDIKGDTPDFSLISRCRNLDNRLFALIIPIRGFKKKYSIADIMVKSRYALRYQGAVALISRISTQLSALLPPRPIFPTKPVLPNSKLILHTKIQVFFLPFWFLFTCCSFSFLLSRILLHTPPVNLTVGWCVKALGV